MWCEVVGERWEMGYDEMIPIPCFGILLVNARFEEDVPNR
jgi:hypothetical protein